MDGVDKVQSTRKEESQHLYRIVGKLLVLGNESLSKHLSVSYSVMMSEIDTMAMLVHTFNLL